MRSKGMASYWFSCYPHFTRLPLALEITLALVIKISVLTLLWHAFFSAPQTKKMRLPTSQVEQHFLKPAAVTPNAAQPVSSSIPKARDATHR